MAVIREELFLYDRFSNTFTRYIQAATQATSATNKTKNSVDNFEKSTKQAATATNGFASAIKSLVSAYVGIQGIKMVLNLSDSISQTTARLDMMNDGLQTTEELNQMIYDSAMRSRGAYQDTAGLVAQLGSMAGDAFDSSAEIVAFAEQLNKQLVISGANGQSASAALFQLQQGLASGTLRGEELNSVMQQTPVIAQTIADYLGVTKGELKELGSEGKITAEIVKNAMFAAANETNAKFEQMPYTWAQVFTLFQNITIKAFEPILQIVGNFAQASADNMDIIAPIIYGVVAAMAAFSVITGVATVATNLLTSAMLGNPIFWIAALIGVIVSLIFTAVQATGGWTAAWLSFKNAVLTLFEDVQIRFKEFSNKFLDGMGNLKVHVLTNIQDMVNGAIDAINKLITSVNKILPGSFELIDHVTFGTEAAIENYTAQQTRANELEALQAEIEANRAARAEEIEALKNETATDTVNTDTTSTYLGEIASDTQSISKAVNATDEDIKSLVDLATRQYINKINLTSQTPVITINAANTGNTAADRKALADTMRDILIEQASAAAVTTTATVF